MIVQDRLTLHFILLREKVVFSLLSLSALFNFLISEVLIFNKMMVLLQSVTVVVFFFLFQILPCLLCYATKFNVIYSVLLKARCMISDRLYTISGRVLSGYNVQLNLYIFFSPYYQWWVLGRLIMHSFYSL